MDSNGRSAYYGLLAIERIRTPKWAAAPPIVARRPGLSDYRTIKELVIETCMAEGALPSSEKLTSLVRQHFPSSKWSKTHYAWYKSKIKTGDIVIPGMTAQQTDSTATETDSEVEGVIEASVSLERDLHAYYASRLADIEPGLTLAPDGVEYQTEAGRIDLLAKDANRQLVVIELKAGRAKDSALGQLSRIRRLPVGLQYQRARHSRRLRLQSPRGVCRSRHCPSSGCSSIGSRLICKKSNDLGETRYRWAVCDAGTHPAACANRDNEPAQGSSSALGDQQDQWPDLFFVP